MNKNPLVKSARRRYKKLQKSAVKTGSASREHVSEFLVGRGASLRRARGRVITWTSIVLFLILAAAAQIIFTNNKFLNEASASGGTYAEGVVGALTTTNPILAESNSERSVSRLMYASLFDYDTKGSIRPQLATDYQIENDTVYTIKLRKDAKWSDGQAVTAKDALYTINLIQNPNIRSPFYSSWRSIKASAPDDYTLRIELPFAFVPFIHSLTFGILPEHIYSSQAATDIRNNSLSDNPVVSGPFTVSTVRQFGQDSVVAYLTANGNYYGRTPEIEHFQIHAYQTQDAVLSAFKRREVGSIAGASLATVREGIASRSDITAVDTPIDNADYAIFNTKSTLLGDAALRKAIRLGTDTAAVRKTLDNRVLPLVGPILPSQVAGANELKIDDTNVEQAKKALDDLGWKVGANGTREKDGQPLSLSLVTVSVGDYPVVATELSRQWTKLGIRVQTELADSDTVSQKVLIPRAYDVLVYELVIGADPDVYAYWHSSQNNANGLNFSGYNSGVADDALSSARDRSDTTLRDAKYLAFAKQWLADAPAIALYQAEYHYVQPTSANSIHSDQVLVSALDRFSNVNDWTSETRQVLKTP